MVRGRVRKWWVGKNGRKRIRSFAPPTLRLRQAPEHCKHLHSKHDQNRICGTLPILTIVPSPPFPIPHLLASPPALEMVQHKLLVANRGEISLRIIRAAKKLGIPCVSIYAEVDSSAPHVFKADESALVPSYIDG